MHATHNSGVMINSGSASKLYPMYDDPIYDGSERGVIIFTRSLAPCKRKGIRINVLCSEFVRTDMAEQVDYKFIDKMGSYLPWKW